MTLRNNAVLAESSVRGEERIFREPSSSGDVTTVAAPTVEGCILRLDNTLKELEDFELRTAFEPTEGIAGAEERLSVESEGPEPHRAVTRTVEDLDEGSPPIDVGFEAANRLTMPGTGTGPELTDCERAEQFRSKVQAQSEIGQKVLEVYLGNDGEITYCRDANYRGDFWGDVIAATVSIAYNECTSGDAWEWTLDRVMRQVRRTRLECLEWETRHEQLDPDDLDMLERRWEGHPESERPLLEAAVDWLSAAGQGEPASWQFVAQHSARSSTRWSDACSSSPRCTSSCPYTQKALSMPGPRLPTGIATTSRGVLVVAAT